MKSEFKARFTDKIVKVLNNCFDIKPNGEWNNGAAVVFKSNKAAQQIKNSKF